MGRADSPLRDRVIFVEGAPRSGTTWLVTLLATHPEIAGVEAESHLFDYGVEHLFDNLEGRDPQRAGLLSYLDREELVDLVRGLCDGVLMAMRSHVSVGSTPPFVVEKTPVALGCGGLDLARKRDCYPDAWYVHIVRDREAVVRSLMRAPWMPDRSPEACGEVWDQAVGTARETLGDLPRYREIPYEDLRRSPVETSRQLFEWLEVSADDRVLDTVARLSAEPFSDMGQPSPTDGRRTARGLVGATRRRLAGTIGRLVEEPAPEGPASALAFGFVRALRERDAEALSTLTAPSLELLYRSADGDRVLRGDDGRAELAAIAEIMFGRRYVSEWWASSGVGPGEWWTRNPDTPFFSLFCSALGGDATRVDLAIGLMVEEDLVRRAVIISAGSLSGRPIAASDAA